MTSGTSHLGTRARPASSAPFSRFFHESSQRKLRVALDAASPVPPAPPVVLPVPAATGTAPSPPARPSQAAILQAYISENRPGKPSVPAVRPEDVDLDAIQEALEGHRLALADCEADARSAPKDDALRRYHLDLLQLWEAHLHAHALVLNLPGDEGVAFLATDAQPEDMVIVDTGSHFNLGPHRMPGENADATGATTGLSVCARSHPSSARRRQEGVPFLSTHNIPVRSCSAPNVGSSFSYSGRRTTSRDSARRDAVCTSCPLRMLSLTTRERWSTSRSARAAPTSA